MPIQFVVLGLLFPAVLWLAPDEPVLWAGCRGGTIEAISMSNLDTVSRVRLPGSVEGVASDWIGRRLFLALPLAADPNGCCSLFALDLPSLHLTFLLEPALRATPAGGRVLTQRGNSGIEVFDSHRPNSPSDSRSAWRISNAALS